MKKNKSNSNNPEKLISNQRPKAIANYIAMLLALARDNKMSHDQLIEWLHNYYEEKGYYFQWKLINQQDPLKTFVQLFISGRSLLYDQIELEEIEEAYIVYSSTWYENDPPESFFYLDIEPEEFAKYAALLATENAKRMGIRIEIKKESNVEVTYIYK